MQTNCLCNHGLCFNKHNISALTFVLLYDRLKFNRCIFVIPISIMQSMMQCRNKIKEDFFNGTCIVTNRHRWRSETSATAQNNFSLVKIRMAGQSEQVNIFFKQFYVFQVRLNSRFSV